MNQTKLLKLTVSALVVTLLTLLYLLISEAGYLKIRSERQVGVNIEQGAILYDLHCKSCHGIRGEGIGQLGPALSDKKFFVERLSEIGYPQTLERYIISTSEHGRMMGTRPFYAGDGSSMVMPPWHRKYGGPLRTDEIEAITSFILNWEQTAKGEIVLEKITLPEADAGDPAMIAAGKKVFIENCASCHRASGVPENKQQGPELDRIKSIKNSRTETLGIENYIRESVLIPEQYLASGFEEMNSHAPCGAILTETELRSIISFLMHQQQIK